MAIFLCSVSDKAFRFTTGRGLDTRSVCAVADKTPPNTVIESPKRAARRLTSLNVVVIPEPYLRQTTASIPNTPHMVHKKPIISLNSVVITLVFTTGNNKTGGGSTASSSNTVTTT
jgi:hypothetical protein